RWCQRATVRVAPPSSGAARHLLPSREKESRLRGRCYRPRCHSRVRGNDPVGVGDAGACCSTLIRRCAPPSPIEGEGVLAAWAVACTVSFPRTRESLFEAGAVCGSGPVTEIPAFAGMTRWVLGTRWAPHQF